MQFLKIILIKIIRIYKIFISPFLGNNCRYLPTCSEYFIDSLNEHGVFKGTLKGTKRVLSCHPIKFFGGGEGFDPVRKKNK
jgi:putative membrane protein insertion efficiency factor